MGFAKHQETNGGLVCIKTVLNCSGQKENLKMKSRLLLFLAVLSFTTASAFAQNAQPGISNEDVNRRTAQSVDDIARTLAKISKALDGFNERLKNFTDTFSSNQGLRLTDKQQKLLAAFEFLNRAEQRLANLQTLKITLSERQTAARMRLAQNDVDSRPESIDRNVAVRGAITDAEEARESRRRALARQRNEINSLISEIQDSINTVNEEIRQTENFLKTIRQLIFPEIQKELSDL
jgi:Skp family chaperone for outer membrane proteins